MSERRYWMTMAYACESCAFEITFYLEDGCEGPWDRVVPAKLAANHPFSPGKEIEVPFTESGRAVVPVPYVAGQCPDCKGVLRHVRWNEDRRLDPAETHIPEDAGAFFYPFDPDEDMACGRPVYAGSGR